jgi:hypothetical protein
MNIFLDDRQEAPKGWVRCFWPEEVITLLKQGVVEKLSLDYNLGDSVKGTGYEVLVWLEDAVYKGEQVCPNVIMIHCANDPEYKKMRQAIASISKLTKKDCYKPCPMACA